MTISVAGNYASATHQEVLDLLNHQYGLDDLNIRTLDGEVIYDDDELSDWINDFEDNVADNFFSIVTDNGSVSVSINGNGTYTVQQVA